MKIAIIGDGRMGGEIARLAPEMGFTVARVFGIGDNSGGAGLTRASLEGVDVCVEFTLPGAAMGNIAAAAAAGKPIVVGTTGWYDRLDEARTIVERAGTGLVWSPNFSVGAALLARLAGEAAALFDRHPEYDAAVREVHHRGKADSPSGTALRIARILLERLGRKSSLVHGNPDGAIDPAALQVSSVRVGEAFGEHSVLFDSSADSLEIVHRAKNRSGFARGALLAARWVRGRKGVFTMDDVLANL